MDHLLSSVNSGRQADHLRSRAEPIACTEARIVDASACPWTPTLPFSTRLFMARLGWSVRDAYHWCRGSRAGI